MPLWPLEGSVFAKTTVQAAWPAFVMKVFEPFRTYSSPRRSAVVFSFGDVGAGLGLGEAEGAEDRLFEQRRQPLRLLLLAAGDDHRAGAEAVRADRGADPGAAPVELLADEDPVEGREAEPAERLGHVQVHQAELVRLGDHVDGVGLVLVVLRRLGPDLLLGELASKLAQTLLLLGQGERDARADTLLDRGHA